MGKIYLSKISNMDIKFEMIASEYYKQGKLHAIAKANVEMLEESKKSVLASEASKYDWSEAYRDRMARQSEAYKTYLKGWQEAIQKELELKYLLDALRMQFEYERSMNSTRRAEMSLS